MSCTRLQSTWSKRGGWNCDTPTLRREMDAEASFLGAKSKLLISFDASLTFEAAEGFARRTLALFESEPKRCLTSAPNPSDWKSAREQELNGLDRSTLYLSIFTRVGLVEVHPFGASALAFNFEPGAAEDPANAQACWEVQIVVD